MEKLYEFFKSIIDNAPSSGTLLLVLDKMKEEGELNQVIRICNKALSMYPKDIHIRKLLAETYTEAGQILQAEAEFEHVTRLIDELTGHYKNLATIYEKQERHDEALKNIKIYLAHHPADEEAAQFLNSIEAAMGHSEREIVDITPLSESHEETTAGDLAFQDAQGLPEIATATLAEIYYSQGQIQDAVTIYEKVIARNPEDYDAVKRLENLREEILAQETSDRALIDLKRSRTEKLIKALESWKSVLRERVQESAI